MAATIKKRVLRLFSSVLPGGMQDSLVQILGKRLATQLGGKVTDAFLELLLRGMDLAFCLSRSYQRNIIGFRATYTFRTKDGAVGCSAVFDKGDMVVESKARSSYDALVSFKNPKALWRFLLGENQDILDSILANEVDVEGNLNYIYKFGYLATDLKHRLGVA